MVSRGGSSFACRAVALLGATLTATISCDAVLGIQDYGPGAQGDGGAREASADAGPDGDSASGSDSPSTPITCVQFTAGGGVTALSKSVPFTSAVTAHDAIIVGIGITSGSGPAAIGKITDTLGNSYTIEVGPIGRVGTADAGFSSDLYIAFAGDVAGDSGGTVDSVTVTLTVSAYMDVYIHEYSGLALTGAFDVGAGGSGTSEAKDAMSSGPATTHAGHELVFGYGGSGQTSAGTGFTPRSTFDTNITEDEVVDTAGSYQATATAGDPSGWIMTMAAFRGQ